MSFFCPVKSTARQNAKIVVFSEYAKVPNLHSLLISTVMLRYARSGDEDHRHREAQQSFQIPANENGQPSGEPGRQSRDLMAADIDRLGNPLDYKWKLFEKRLDYSQSAFNHHAKQRMQMFNFFVVFAALAANAWTALYTDEKYIVAAVVAVLAAVASLVFYILDLRIEELIHIAEANLKALVHQCISLHKPLDSRQRRRYPSFGENWTKHQDTLRKWQNTALI